uniref:protein ABHD18 isoform X2 n=1 Tax=Myxine glutinosa TaxID=7769 RepID=UPI00358FE2DB
MSLFDVFYRRLLLSRFFIDGWGSPETLKRIMEFRKLIGNREICRSLVPPDYPVTLDKFFWRRRRFMARPMIKEAGIASLLLENPYYGYRKPKGQVRSCLRRVADLFVMGGALVLESACLLHWLRRQGLGPLGMSGVSMGGHMASIAVSNWPEPIPLVPCLSWSTASGVFTTGVLSQAVSWRELERQFAKDGRYQHDVTPLLQYQGTDSFWEGWEAFSQESQSHACPPQRWLQICQGRKVGRLMNLFGNIAHQFGSCEKKKDELPQSLSVDFHEGSGQRATCADGCNNIGTTTSLKNKVQHAVNIFGKETASTSNGLEDEITRSLDQLVGEASATINTEHEVPGLTAVQEDRASVWCDTLLFMKGVMDECTHLANYSVPVDPSLVVVVVALRDGYIPKAGVLGLPELWPSCEVRYIDRGHISACLFSQATFRKAIYEAFDRYTKKYLDK